MLQQRIPLYNSLKRRKDLELGSIWIGKVPSIIDLSNAGRRYSIGE